MSYRTPEVQYQTTTELSSLLRYAEGLNPLFAALALELHARKHADDELPVLPPNNITVAPYVFEDEESLNCLLETSVNLADKGKIAIETFQVNFSNLKDSIQPTTFATDETGEVLMILPRNFAMVINMIGGTLVLASKQATMPDM